MSSPSNHPAAAYPTWLKHPLVPLTVVLGPPGNGAAAHVASKAGPGEMVIDTADIIAEISGGAPGDWIIQALALRNERLSALSDAVKVAKAGIIGAWLITGAPLQWQRDFWSMRGGRLVVLDPGKQAAIAGAAAEGVQVRWVHRWYAEAADAMAGLIAPAPRLAASPAGSRPQTERPSASKRGYGTRHNTLRDKQLLIEPHCRFCWAERGVKVPATVLDHVVPFRNAANEMDYKLWGDPKNHRSLCKPCHDARGARRDRAEKPAGAATDGRPMDPAHPWNRR